MLEHYHSANLFFAEMNNSQFWHLKYFFLKVKCIKNMYA